MWPFFFIFVDFGQISPQPFLASRGQPRGGGGGGGQPTQPRLGTPPMFCVLGLYGRFRRQGNLEYEVRVFLKGGRPPPALQTHPHTHTMCEKRRYNGALRILAVFQGRASQPAGQGGGGRGGGFQSLPATQPQLGAAPFLFYQEALVDRFSLHACMSHHNSGCALNTFLLIHKRCARHH